MDHISFNSIYMRFGAGLQAWVESRMRLYASRDGSLLALRNEAGGPLRVERRTGRGMDLRISSRSLTQILEYWHPTGRRIPAVYADGPDAILLSRQEELEEDMSETEFLCRFHPLATEGMRSYGVEVRKEGQLSLQSLSHLVGRRSAGGNPGFPPWLWPGTPHPEDRGTTPASGQQPYAVCPEAVGRKPPLSPGGGGICPDFPPSHRACYV